MASRIFIALVAGTLLCGACAGNGEQKRKLAEELRLFRETPIAFPEHLLAKRSDGEAPDTTLLRRPLKMVVYVNQDGCEGCKMQALLPVHQFMLENKPFEHFGVVIILNPSHLESADHLLKELRFRQTVFYDLDGSFERLNPHLPKSERFHTFLLNEDNQVVLIGNPVHHAKLKNLYLAALNQGRQ